MFMLDMNHCILSGASSRIILKVGFFIPQRVRPTLIVKWTYYRWQKLLKQYAGTQEEFTDGVYIDVNL